MVQAGSPVILKPVAGRIVKNKVQLGQCQPVLLGIMSETRYREPEQRTLADIGLAVNATMIKETVDKAVEDLKRGTRP